MSSTAITRALRSIARSVRSERAGVGRPTILAAVKEIFRSLLKGYQELKPLTDSELENLPVLCSGSALRFLLTRVDNWNSSNEVDIAVFNHTALIKVQSNNFSSFNHSYQIIKKNRKRNL